MHTHTDWGAWPESAFTHLRSLPKTFPAGADSNGTRGNHSISEMKPQFLPRSHMNPEDEWDRWGFKWDRGKVWHRIKTGGTMWHIQPPPTPHSLSLSLGLSHRQANKATESHQRLWQQLRVQTKKLEARLQITYNERHGAMARERGQTNKNVSGGSEQKKNADRCTEEPKQETEDNGSNFFVFFLYRNDRCFRWES